MKRVLAWVLVLTLCLGLFAGCKKKDNNETPNNDNVVSSVADLEAALEYIKTVYKKVGEKTPKDFQRIGNVPVNGKNYEVVWTADVGEEYVKVVKGNDGMVTIDVKEDVDKEVKYVLTATISDDAGNSVSHSWNHLLPVAGNMAAIVEEAYLLESGASMGYEVTLTGKITAINTPWDAGYKNITVTIIVEGAEDKPIQCYRLAGEGADKLKPNDIITVTGTLKNYNGTIEFDAGCTLDAVIEGEEVKAPTDSKQIIAEAYALAENGALPYKATLTGVITKVNTEYNPGYKNVTVTMVVDGDNEHPIQCYRLAGEGADQIGKGDTITVTGWIVNYKGTVQFGQGCTLDSWKDTGANVPKPEDTFTTTLVPEIVTNPQAGVAYKFFLEQKNYGKNFYMTGNMDGYYYETTYDPAKAVDVYLEEVSGGWRAYFMKDGVKNYMEMVVSGTHKNVIFTTSPTKALKWNSEVNTLTCDLVFEGENKDYYWGTYSFYKTFSASDIARVTGSDADLETNFVGHLATLKETAVEEKSAAEKAFEALKEEYFVASDAATTTAEDYTRKNVYDVEGTKVNVVWTENSDAVEIIDNGDGTVTVKVTRGAEDAAYTLTATITDGDKTHTTSWECIVPKLPPVSAKDILDAAYALEPGQSMADKVTLTGIIAEVNTPYSADYDNITVTILVEDIMDKPIMCYRMKGEGIADLQVFDNITVTGIIKNYNGTIEFDTGCTMDARMTMAEVVDAAYALESGKALEEKYTLVGVVTSVDTPYSEEYGNITVTMAVPGCEDKPIMCYRLSGSGVELLDVGYTIAVYGQLKNYNGIIEFDKGCVLLDYAAPEVEDPEEPEVPETEFEELTTLVQKPVDAPEIGVAYKFYLNQASLGKVLYFNGALSGNYLAVTDKVDEAVDVFVEEATDGYNLYFMNGDVKTYIGIEEYQYEKDGQMKTSTKMTLTEAPNVVFTIHDTLGVYQTVINGTTYYVGTYNNYSTMSASKISYINDQNKGVSQFPAALCTLMQQPATPEVGVAHKYYVNQANLEKALYFNGQLSGNYLATTENALEAVDVFVEETTGGYSIYFMDGETKNYICIEEYTYVSNGQNKTGSKIVLSETAGAVFTVNEDLGIFQTDVNGTAYYIGTYNNYATMSASKISYINADNMGLTQFPAVFGILHVQNDEEEEGPTTTTVTVSMAEYATANSWSNGTQYSTVVMDENVTVTATGGQNTGKYYNSGTNWRIYQSENPSVTIAAAGGNIVSVKISYLSQNNGCLTLNGENVASDTVVDVNAPSVTFSVGNTGSATNGQARITAIEVVYAAAEETPAPTTVTVSMADYATANNWSNGTQYSTVVMDENVTVTATGGQNTGKYYNSGTNWRIYQSENPSVTIAAAEGNIVSVKISYLSQNNGCLTLNGQNVASDTLVDVNAPSVTFSVGNTGSATNGQARITAIEVIYATQASSGSQGGNPGSGEEDGDTPETPVGDPITNVEYVYGSSSAYSNVIKNWGRRGFTATFLSPNAEAFYADNNVTYEQLAAMEGSTNVNNVPTSALYIALQDLMESNHTKQTTYGETRYLYCFTDCQDQNDAAGISCFYSGNTIGPDWDSGNTWNREHCWPKSKANATWNSSNSNSNSGELGDLMTLRPVVSNINSSRSNKAYGISDGYYNPNSCTNLYDLRGDVARIVLYTYVRWEDSAHMWGTEGVIENVEVLLDWMEADPVDTWEMGRNDSVESVTGTRNVFVDYPELAFILFGEEVPTMTTPSGKAAA